MNPYLPLYATLADEAGTGTLTFNGGPGGPGLFVTSAGIEGWMSTPELKLELSERGGGNGAHDIAAASILYAARVVTVHWAARAATREQLQDLVTALLRIGTGRLVRLRVVDATSDTWAGGAARVEVDPPWRETAATGVLIITCPRPERLATTPTQITLTGLMTAPGGLLYGPAAAGLTYPLSYGAGGLAQNTGTLTNRGSAPAHPVVRVNGPFPDGITLQVDAGAIAFTQPVDAVPLVLDFRSRTATMGGAEVSRHLTARGFHPIPPGGSMSISVQSAGTGWVNVDSCDTYL